MLTILEVCWLAIGDVNWCVNAGNAVFVDWQMNYFQQILDRLYDTMRSIDSKVNVSKPKVTVFDRKNGAKDCKLHINNHIYEYLQKKSKKSMYNSRFFSFCYTEKRFGYVMTKYKKKVEWEWVI